MGGQRPGKEWVGPGIGKIRAITCLGGVSALVGLVLVPIPPPRNCLERNRKGKAKISTVVVGWLH